MAVNVTTRYDGFVCVATVSSSSIDEIDLTADDFRIDIIDQFKAAQTAVYISTSQDNKSIAEKERDSRDDFIIDSSYEKAAAKYTDSYTFAQLNSFYDEEVKNLKYTSSSEETQEIISGLKATIDSANEEVDKYEKQIQEYLSELNTPLLTINNKGDEKNTAILKSDVFANSDDESLLKNGMQYWVSKDKKSLTFRFIPNNASRSFNAIVVLCALDYENVTRFEVCLIPQLITGDLEKFTGEDPLGLNPPESDPIIPKHNRVNSEGQLVNDDYRPDYSFNNDELDNDHVYVNNTQWTLESDASYPHKTTSAITPLYVLKSSAFITDELTAAGYSFNWSKFTSTLYDVTQASSIMIPYSIGENNVSSVVDETPEPIVTTAKIFNDYSGSNTSANEFSINCYEIRQFIETSANVPVYSKNQLRVSISI